MKKQMKSAFALSSAVVAVVGLALVPTLNADAITANTNVRAIVGSTITLTTSTQVDLTLSPGATPVLTSASDAVTVNTNDTDGYLLTLADADATETLTSGGNVIAASANSSTAAAALATNTWGFALPGATSFDVTYNLENNSTASTSKWAKIPSTGAPFTLKSTATVASNDLTTVWYAAKIDSTKPSGTYTNSVVYTATVK